MTQVPTAVEILDKYSHRLSDGSKILPRQSAEKAMIEYAKLHREAILEAAAEEARTCIKYWRNAPDETIVDKDSILNSYPVELIK